MHETETHRPGETDALAEIIRAAGKRPEPPREHYDQVYAAARSAWRSKLRSRRTRRWFALAASVLALGFAGLLSGLLVTGESGPAASLVMARGSVERFSEQSGAWEGIAGSGLVLAVGERLRTSNGPGTGASFELAAGGSLRLDAGTELELGVESVRLAAGRIYFDSLGRAGAAAFAVQTPLGVIHDIGTQFEARVETDSLRIRVREGEVALQQAPADLELTGTAGEEIEVSAAGNLRTGVIAPDAALWQWAQSLASAPAPASQSILVYLRWIARETGKRLEFELANVELSAQFASFSGDPAGLSPLEVLNHIAATSDFRYQLTEDGAILIGRN